ncbi:TPA: hypothetical protein ACKFMW_000890, partial [Enterobacter hormaechei]
TIFSCKELCVEGDFMAQLLIFADDEPAKLLKIRSYRSKILYLYANNEVRCLDVVIFFSTFLKGESGVILVAADRYVSRKEIIEAYDALIG